MPASCRWSTSPPASSRACLKADASRRPLLRRLQQVLAILDEVFEREQPRRLLLRHVLHLAELAVDGAAADRHLVDLVRGLVQLLLHGVHDLAVLAELRFHRAQGLPDLARALLD